MAAASSTDSVVCVTYASASRDRDREPLDVGDRFDQVDAAVALPHRAFDLGMSRMADHHDLAAVRAHLRDFDVHLGHERTRRVEHA